MENNNKTKNKILDSATKLFAKKGFNATSMNDIASKVKIEKSSLYYFYKNKNDLFIAVLEKLWSNLLHDIQKVNLQKINSKASAMTQLAKVINIIIKSGLKSGLTIIDINSPEIITGKSCKIISSHIFEIQNIITKLLTKIKTKNPELAQQIILNAIHAYVIHSQKHKQTSRPLVYGNYLTNLFI